LENQNHYTCVNSRNHKRNSEPVGNEQFILIRKMLKSDVEWVSNLENEIFANPWSRESINRFVLDERGCNWVADIQRRGIGYIFSIIVPDEIHILNLAVIEEFRGRKIGERLFAQVNKKALMQSCQSAWLEVRASNIPALNLYKKFGFNVIGVRKGYYTDNGEDALVMTASLTSNGGRIYKNGMVS